MSKTDPYRITGRHAFKLADHDSAATHACKDKKNAAKLLQQSVEHLSHLQEKLYAQNSHALLLIFQAMDAAGKDGAIKHVMSGINPQGCDVRSFKVPSAEELSHDYLWRAVRGLPERGRIGIFNRSYYEEVLVVRVHPELLAAQKLPKIPKANPGKALWQERFEEINAFERHLTQSGIVIRKFFLNVSKEEQKRRFLSRLEEPAKNWKFSNADIKERGYWSAYMHAYEEMIRHTSTPEAPWYVIPADHKWYTRLAVSTAIIETLETLNLKFPEVDAAQKKNLVAMRKALLAEEA